MRNKIIVQGLLIISIGLFLFEHIQVIVLYGFTSYLNTYWIDFITNFLGSLKTGLNSQLADLIFIGAVILYFKKYNLVGLILSLVIYLLMYNRFIYILFDFSNNYILIPFFLLFIGLVIYYLRTYKVVFLIFFLVGLFWIYFDRDYRCNEINITCITEIDNSFKNIFRECAGIYARITAYLIMIMYGLIELRKNNATQHSIYKIGVS